MNFSSSEDNSITLKFSVKSTGFLKKGEENCFLKEGIPPVSLFCLKCFLKNGAKRLGFIQGPTGKR